MLRQIGDKDQTIQNLEALLQKTKDSVSQLEAEREDLVAKIQAGEGETAVLNQLQEKNHTLQTQVGTKAHAYGHAQKDIYIINTACRRTRTYTQCSTMFCIFLLFNLCA